MAATRDEIERWFEQGLVDNATHMIVVCDTYDWEDYPVYVMPGQNPREVAEEYGGKGMRKIMEVYSLKMDMEKQLNEHRAFHYD